MSGSAVAESVHRDHILADRVAVAIEIVHFELERARVVAGVMNLAFNRHTVAASHESSVRHLDRFHAGQRVEHVGGEKYRAEQNDERALTHGDPSSMIAAGRARARRSSSTPFPATPARSSADGIRGSSA